MRQLGHTFASAGISASQQGHLPTIIFATSLYCFVVTVVSGDVGVGADCLVLAAYDRYITICKAVCIAYLPANFAIAASTCGVGTIATLAFITSIVAHVVISYHL